MIDSKLNVNVTNHPTNGIQTEGTLPAHHGEHMHLDEVGERQESLLTLGEQISPRMLTKPSWKKLIKQVAVRKVERAKLRGFDGEILRATRAETKALALIALARLARAQDEVELVLEICSAPCPALPEHELTLSGWRKLDASVGKRLKATGYKAGKTGPTR